jgi:uncharacterized protein YlaI
MICYLCERKLDLRVAEYVMIVVRKPTHIRTYQCYDCEAN